LAKKILHLLIVDDSPDDADLSVAALRQHGYMVKSQRVHDITSMQTALDKNTWDVAVAKHSFAHFGARRALDMLKRTQHDIPLVVFAEKISDDEIAEIMTAGARDVVRKGDLGRLVPLIERELAVTREQRHYREANDRLKEVEGKHQAMIDGAREAICYCHEGMHVDANRAYLQLFGYDGLTELEGVPVLDLVDRSDHTRFKDYLRKVTKKNQKTDKPEQFTALRKDGGKLPVEVSLSLINLGGETCTQIVVNDLSTRATTADEEADTEERDTLTGVHEREYFLRELGKAIDQAKLGRADSALVYLELDGLKDINEKSGRDIGDQLLREVATQFRRTLPKGALLARFGGDEFVVLLARASHTEAQNAIERLTQGVARAAKKVGAPGNVTQCTCGLIMIDRTAESVEKILSLAYSATEQTKKQKRVALTATPTKDKRDEAADPATARADQWRERIQRALDHDSFQLVYQPVINLIGDPSEYYEVLLRVAGENDDLVAAGEFMPFAERSGQVHAIDHWVLRQAMTGLGEMHKEGQHAAFFINLSKQAIYDDDIVPLISEVLTECKLEGQHIILELDESILELDANRAATFIRDVNKLHCRLSLDSFSARMATLDRLRDLPVEFLKIDGTIARNAATDNIKQIMLKTIVQIAKLLNKKTIGKCVEDEETLSLLYSYELDYLQGNYFQHADAAPEYKFAGETTLSSDMDPLSGWPPSS
jgi:diguanylate cyclase (GGDEF)-like protein/PAS domain S-box-containing protein